MSNVNPASTNRVIRTLVERHVWKLFLGLGILIALFGAGDMWSGGTTFATGENALFEGFTGTTWENLQASDPNVANLIDYQVRAGGAGLLIAGILSGIVSLTGFRRGERWAWYAMWIWPLWTALVILLLSIAPRLPGAGTPVPLISGSILLVISASALALAYPTFFVRRKSEGAQTV